VVLFAKPPLLTAWLLQRCLHWGNVTGTMATSDAAARNKRNLHYFLANMVVRAPRLRTRAQDHS
jgi:hypothetical protein